MGGARRRTDPGVRGHAQYTATDFASLDSAVAGKAGGIAEATAAWSGTVWRGEQGANAHLGITGRLAADNIDGSLDARTSKQSGEGMLTLRSGAWLIKGRYSLAHEGSDENPPKRDLEFTLSLSRPVVDKHQAGLDAKAVDSHSFEPNSGEVKSLKEALEAALWVKYTPRPWLEAVAKVKGMWGWYGPEPKTTDFDRYLEGQLRLRF